MRNHFAWAVIVSAAVVSGGLPVLATGSTTARAQSTPKSGGELGAKLGLTAEQKVSVRKILNAAHEKA